MPPRHGPYPDHNGGSIPRFNVDIPVPEGTAVPSAPHISNFPTPDVAGVQSEPHIVISDMESLAAAALRMDRQIRELRAKVATLETENKALRAQTPEPEPTYLKHAPWPNVISYCSTPCLSVQGQRIIGYAMAAGPEFLALRYMEELKARDEQFDKMRDTLRDIFSRSAFADESSRESLKFVLREIGARAGGSLPK